MVTGLSSALRSIENCPRYHFKTSFLAGFIKDNAASLTSSKFIVVIALWLGKLQDKKAGKITLL
jgi:hypothetical protein